MLLAGRVRVRRNDLENRLKSGLLRRVADAGGPPCVDACTGRLPGSRDDQQRGVTVSVAAYDTSAAV
jgi:hypothetical protein